MDAITQPKQFVFVLMPFTAEFDDVYSLGIKAACQEAGAYSERVDEQFFGGSILERIYNQISKADIIIADMSGKNPNVFYEVGYAHALGKQVVLLTQRADDIPFDLKHFPHIVYGGKITMLKSELTKRIAWLVQHPKASIAKAEPVLEVFVDGVPLVNCPTIGILEIQESSFEINLHNPTNTTYKAGSFKVGLITRDCYHDGENFRTKKPLTSIMMPDSKTLHVIEDSETLFPNFWQSFQLFLNCGSRANAPTSEEYFCVRLFSEVGYIDFPFKRQFMPELG
jgi:hypothetical protein